MQGKCESRQNHLQKVHFHWLVREPAAPRCVPPAHRQEPIWCALYR